MTSLTKPDPRTVLRRVTDNNSESSDALDQRVQAIKDRIAALQKQSDTFGVKPLPSYPIEASNFLLKRTDILKETLAAMQDLLRLLAKYD